MPSNQKKLKKTFRGFTPLEVARPTAPTGRTCARARLLTGFTLIETVVYIALLGLIMGGTLTIVYQLLESYMSLNSKTYIQSEADFVLRKISWALLGIDPNQPIIPSSGNDNKLSLIKYDGTKVDICLDSSDPLKKVIKMRENSAAPLACTDPSFLPLTTENVIVDDLKFQSIPSAFPGPSGIAATMIINSKDFTITKYLRQ